MIPGDTPSLSGLVDLLKRLRAPDGCPWDREQSSADIGRCLLDEAYEVVDALATGHTADLREELGDLLFQILFLVEIAADRGEFTLPEVIDGIAEKMVRRHPHVFGEKKVNSSAEVKRNWLEIKKTVEGKSSEGLLAGIPRSMPALRRAQKMTERAAAVGFDWSRVEQVVEKVVEEMGELEKAMTEGRPGRITEEIGDVFLSLVNLSRFLHVDAENALGAALDKFSRRFAHIEDSLKARGMTPEGASLAVMDGLWEEAKRIGKDQIR